MPDRDPLVTGCRPRAALVVPYHDEHFGAEPRAALARVPSAAGFARGLVGAGWSANGVHHFCLSAEVVDDRTRHVFVRPSWPVRTLGRVAARAWPRHGPAYWQPSARLARAAVADRPSVVHVFGMTIDWQLALIARACRRSGSALVLHYHGGLPDGDALTRRVRAANLRSADRVLFTHRDQAEPWLRDGLLTARQVGELPETSSWIAPLPRAAPSASPSGPRCLMVGRLHPVKAPLVALDAFERVAAARPGARLDVVGGDGGLGEACRQRVAASPMLMGRVVFHGHRPPADMPRFYAGADILLHASRREWSSLAVIEALACGVVPCASDLPALRALTGNGRVGRLVPAGDPVALADAVLAYDTAALARTSRSAARHFAEHLSFAALGRRLASAYEEVLRGR